MWLLFTDSACAEDGRKEQGARQGLEMRVAGRPCTDWIGEFTEENLLARPDPCGARLEAGSMQEVWLDLSRADPPR